MVNEASAPTPNIEVLRSSIQSFQDSFVTYREMAGRYRQAREGASRLFSEAHGEHSRLWLRQRELFEEREKQLRAQLDSDGLAICSASTGDIEPYNHHHHQYEDTLWGSSDPPRKYGVFPKNEMTMVYSHHTYQSWHGDHYHEELVTHSPTEFRILCPVHAPKSEQENYSKPSNYGNQYGLDEWTRVLEKDGKLVRELDDREVHGLPVQGEVDTALYDHFGYPQIPEIPEEVRY